MKLKTKRVDKNLSLPEYETGAACFDFVCREDAVIKPKEIKLVPLNSVIKLPEGYTVLIFMRSSTPLKKGVIMANSVGVLDSFYCGDSDEIITEFFNITDHDVEIKRGEILVQGMLLKHEVVDWEEVEKMEDKGRGGYVADLGREDKKK